MRIPGNVTHTYTVVTGFAGTSSAMSCSIGVLQTACTSNTPVVLSAGTPISILFTGGAGLTRHGTITLFAALNYLDGKIASYIAPEHTNVQWLAFLKQLDREMPDDVTLHLIVDNYGTHKHPNVRSWLKWRNSRNRTNHGIERIVLHFTPTSSSWMNLVERFFRDLTEDAIRDESFDGVAQLVAAINGYLAERNLAPKRYIWKAEGAEILRKIEKARAAMLAESV